MSKACVVCGAAFLPKGRKNTCSPKCRRIRHRQKKDEHNRRNGLRHNGPDEPPGANRQLASIGKERRCLKCDRVFHSRGKANRLCPGCNTENERQERGHKYRPTAEELAERIEYERMKAE